MDKLDIQSTFDDLIWTEKGKKENYLIFCRAQWESERFKHNGFSFTKEELDNAENLDIKLIGVKNGIKCYLHNNFI